VALPKYLDFDLLIERAGDHFRARVLESPGGQGAHDFDLPFDDKDLQIFTLSILGQGVRVRRIDDPGMKEVREFGTRLFQAVFDEDVLTCLDRSLYEAERQEASLRLQLRIADDSTREGVSLAGVPWEFLFDRRSGGSFLAVSEKSTVVRFPSVPRPVEPLLMQPPLRLLAVICSPRGFPELDVEKEWQNLNDALAHLTSQGKVVSERLEPATTEALQGQVRRGGPYHVFHFIGHGAFDERRDEGVLLFETSEGKPDRVSGEDLKTLLGREPSLRLAILNACEGARTSKEDPFAGVAQSLIQSGLPAVIAMQMPVTDQSAIALSREFYGSLADGYPVDAALAEARTAIKTRVNAVEWGVPVLYMRSRDGLLFDVGAPSIDPAAAAAAAAAPATLQPLEIESEEQPAKGQLAKEQTEQKPSEALVERIGRMSYRLAAIALKRAGPDTYVYEGGGGIARLEDSIGASVNAVFEESGGQQATLARVTEAIDTWKPGDLDLQVVFGLGLVLDTFDQGKPSAAGAAFRIVMDHWERDTLDLGPLIFCVLAEADEESPDYDPSRFQRGMRLIIENYELGTIPNGLLLGLASLLEEEAPELKVEAAQLAVDQTDTPDDIDDINWMLIAGEVLKQNGDLVRASKAGTLVLKNSRATRDDKRRAKALA
jgi:CHAT domain